MNVAEFVECKMAPSRLLLVEVEINGEKMLFGVTALRERDAEHSHDVILETK